jgi:hypothetical protein
LAALPARRPSTRTRGMTPGTPGLSATAWDQCPDRAPRDRVVEAAGPLPLAGGAGAVVVELLQTAAGPLGSGLRPVLCVSAAGLCAGLRQPALVSRPRRGGGCRGGELQPLKTDWCWERRVLEGWRRSAGPRWGMPMGWLRT